MRLFFGLALPASTAVAVADWRDRALHCDGKAVAVANFHITLAFLGELPAPRLEPLCLAVDRALAGADSARGRLQLDQVGYWPRPGIFWLGPREWPANLNALVDRLSRIGAAFGARVDRNRFQPHVTLFRRCATPPPLPVCEPHISFDYSGVTLFESRRSAHAISYEALAQWS